MSIHEKYKEHGVTEYYKKNASEYSNPHSLFIIPLLAKLNFASYCDLACGNGLVSKHLTNCYGIDPFFTEIYRNLTGNECLPYSFRELAFDYSFELPRAEAVVVSYAFDLIELDIRELLLLRLKQSFEFLVTIRPNKHEIVVDYLEPIHMEKNGKSVMRIYRFIN